MKERECGISGRKLTAGNYNARRETFPDGKISHHNSHMIL